MPTLKLMPKFECYPTWIEADGILENVCPSTLGLSKALLMAVVQWDKQYQGTYNRTEPSASRFTTATEAAEFDLQGRSLAASLASELGEEFQIAYWSVLRDDSVP